MASWMVYGALILMRLCHRLLQVVGLAEVAVQQPAEVLDVLHGQRLVEPEMDADRGDALGRRGLAGDHDGGVAGDREEDDERDHAHAEQDDDHLEETPDDVRHHAANSPASSLRRAGVGGYGASCERAAPRRAGRSQAPCPPLGLSLT